MVAARLVFVQKNFQFAVHQCITAAFLATEVSWVELEITSPVVLSFQYIL